MVVIMPTLTKTQQSDNPLVVALIVRLELTFAKHVADGIDTPGDVVREENAHEATPEETGPSANSERDH